MRMVMGDIHVSVQVVTLVPHARPPIRILYVVRIHVFMVDHVLDGLVWLLIIVLVHLDIREIDVKLP